MRILRFPPSKVPKSCEVTPADLKPNNTHALFVRDFPARGRTIGDLSKHMEEDVDTIDSYINWGTAHTGMMSKLLLT